MKRVLLLLVLLPVASLFAQPQPQPGPRPSPENDPIAKYLIPPELVMTHSQEIALTEAQSNAIKAELRKTQSKFLDLQWDMQEQSGRMIQLLQQSPVDEAKVLEQADKVMSLEREIKRTQLTMLIRLKNQHTPAQIATLMSIRDRERPMGR